MLRSDSAPSWLRLLLLALLVITAAPTGVSASSPLVLQAQRSEPPADVRRDTGRVEAALRHFYALYTSRDYDALYARAAPRVRNGGLQKESFRQFMRKRRERRGPARLVSVDGPSRVPEAGPVRATAQVRHAKGTRAEQWRLVVQNDTVRWRSFQTTGRPESGRSEGASGGSARSQDPLAEGRPLPTFEVQGLRDSTQTISLSDFEGQYVLLNFWATWCTPCIEKLPQLRRAARRHDTLAILNVSFDRRRSDVTSFLQEETIPGVHAFLGMRRFQGRLTDRLGVDRLPHPVLVGPAGQVVAEERRIEREGILSVLRQEIEADSID